MWCYLLGIFFRVHYRIFLLPLDLVSLDRLVLNNFELVPQHFFHCFCSVFGDFKDAFTLFSSDSVNCWFSDEPTTGLDATTALSVLELLKDLSKKNGNTVIFSIHQPRYNMYRLFDTVHLLSLFGETVYHGPAKHAVSYFAQKGFPCDVKENPADFFLDLIIDNSRSAPSLSNQSNTAKLEEEADGKVDLAAIFANSDLNKSLLERCEQIEIRAETNQSEPYYKNLPRATNWFFQFYYLYGRFIRNVLFSPRLVLLPTIVSLIIGLLFGWLNQNWQFDLAGFQNLYGALFFLVIEPVMASFPAIDIMLEGHKFFIHETARGYYTPSAFLAAKVLSELILLCGIPTLLFTVSSYFLLHLKHEVIPFCVFLLTNMLGSLAACCFIFFVSIAAGSIEVATSILPATLVIMLLFSGLFLNVTSLSSVLRFLQYTSIPRHMLALQASYQLESTSFCGERELMTPNGNATYTEYSCQSGNSLLDLNGIGYDFNSRLGYFLGILAFPILFLPLSYLVLRTTAKRFR